MRSHSRVVRAQAFDVSGVSEYTVASNMVRNRSFYIEIPKKIRFLTIFEASAYSETQGTSNACGQRMVMVQKVVCLNPCSGGLDSSKQVQYYLS